MKYLPSLNGLRAISILMVWMSHLNIGYFKFDSPLLSIFYDGQIAVNIFFVISGFLITSLLLNEESKTGQVSLSNFYYRRTLRIFPAYYFMLLVYYFLTKIHVIGLTKGEWLVSATYTKDFFRGGSWYTEHTWSLSIEEQFYILWPPIFLFLKKYRNLVLVFLICSVPVIRIIKDYNYIEWISIFHIFYRIDAIAIGCFMAINKEAILSKVTFNKRNLFIAFIILFSVRFMGQEWDNIKDYHLAGVFMAGFLGSSSTVANLCISFIILYSIYNKNTVWFTVLNNKVLYQIGLWSYSMYLWQQFFFYNTGQWYNQFPLNIALALIASIGSYYLIEKPFLKLRDIKKAAIKAA